MTELEMAVQELRDVLDKTFAPDTAVAGTTSAVPSAGHCAVAAIVARLMLGGSYVSARVDGASHWFNRIRGFDVDVTGDQFGRPKVQVATAGTLYPDTRERLPSDLNAETCARADLLFSRMCTSGDLRRE